MSDPLREIALASGHTMPLIGLGTGQLKNSYKPMLAQDSVKSALELGYKHFDCAAIYANESDLGQVFGTTDRLKLFVTSKVWNNQKETPEQMMGALTKTLQDLQLKYLDLYLIHWPATWIERDQKHVLDLDLIKMQWRTMESFVKQGLVQSIGVSNFTIPLLEHILSFCEIQPSVNQVEMHPYLQQPELLDFCLKHQIVITAYSPLGSSSKENAPLQDPVILKIAQKHNASPAQVIVSWALKRGYAAIPKSSNPQRMRENQTTVALDQDDMERIRSLDRNQRKFDGLDLGVNIFGTL
ncbi:aldehyde reductase-like protein [Gorgonomyces haynaldii]|nr:aldehyde reductase-like protein [Gorgonomyces haynaldii]